MSGNLAGVNAAVGAAFNATIVDPGAPADNGLDLNSNGFMLWGAAMVFIMTPGLGFFYSGMTRSKNALVMIMLCMLAMCVVSFQWFVMGYSLAFAEWDNRVNGTGGSSFIGNFDHAFLGNVGADSLPMTAPAISSVVFMIYQMQFATITAALIFGSVAERVRILPAMIFIFIWTTLVYDPIAYWTWSWRGWIHNMACISTATSPNMEPGPCGTGGLDFAGGGPVHMTSGFAGLAFCIVLGKRRRVGLEEFKPHNLANVFLGCTLLWFGWFAFNGGSALAGTARAGMAGAVTHIATISGALSWPLWDYVISRKMSGLGFCSGAVSALVAITPASGFVAPWAAVIIGATTGIVCNLACRIKGLLGFDDSLDAWGVHGIGGFLGNIMTGVFAQKWVAGLDDTTTVRGGLIDGNKWQLLYQLIGSLAIACYSFGGSFIILTVINLIPGLHLRPSDDEEILGGDLGEMGEVAYELVSSVIDLAETPTERTHHHHLADDPKLNDYTHPMYQQHRQQHHQQQQAHFGRGPVGGTGVERKVSSATIASQATTRSPMSSTTGELGDVVFYDPSAPAATGAGGFHDSTRAEGGTGSIRSTGAFYEPPKSILKVSGGVVEGRRTATGGAPGTQMGYTGGFSGQSTVMV
ncbi:hypothetical protein HK101_002353 [Irineochytrium annulatum]|nr:hypothetical protein HK101_002353 [Irineochytrium annulatum]